MGSYPRPDVLELCPHVGLQVMMILVIPHNPHQIFITSFRPLILTPMDIQPQSQSTDIELHKEKNFSDHKRILLWTSFFADPSFSLRKDTIQYFLRSSVFLLSHSGSCLASAGAQTKISTDLAARSSDAWSRVICKF